MMLKKRINDVKTQYVTAGRSMGLELHTHARLSLNPCFGYTNQSSVSKNTQLSQRTCHDGGEIVMKERERSQMEFLLAVAIQGIAKTTFRTNLLSVYELTTFATHRT